MSPDNQGENASLEPTTTKRYVFISHSSLDAEVVLRVRDDLEANGIGCWMAPRDVPLGTDHAVAIRDAIASCPVFLLFVSQGSMASVDVGREVHLAANAKARIIPVRLEDIKLTASLEYLLADVQHTDAFPRVEPMLGRLREQIHDALKKRGTVIRFSRRSPFGQILVIASAWAVVAALDWVALEIVRRAWFNMLPYDAAMLAALRTPRFLLVAAIPPVLALSLQFWANRNPGRIFTLDALFAFASGQARVRLAASALIVALGAIATMFLTPTISLQLVEGAPPTGTEFIRAESCNQGDSYPMQKATHYRLDMRVGSGNPATDYIVDVEVAPYATADGVEFCDIWLDRALASRSGTIVVDHKQSTGHYTVSGLRDAFPGRHSLLFTVMHYRDSKPNAIVRTSLAQGPVRVEEHAVVSTPLR